MIRIVSQSGSSNGIKILTDDGRDITHDLAVFRIEINPIQVDDILTVTLTCRANVDLEALPVEVNVVHDYPQEAED